MLKFSVLVLGSHLCTILMHERLSLPNFGATLVNKMSTTGYMVRVNSASCDFVSNSSGI